MSPPWNVRDFAPSKPSPSPRTAKAVSALRDPSRLTDAVATLPPVAVAIVQLFDGDSTRAEICAEFERRYGTPLQPEALDTPDRPARPGVPARLRSLPPVLGHRLRRLRRSRRRARRTSPARATPPIPPTLAAQLDGYFDAPARPRPPRRRRGPLPRAIVAPHIDFARGGAAYAWAYKPLAEAATLPELVVVFGTDHMGAEQPFTLHAQALRDPARHACSTDVELVDALAEQGRRAARQERARRRSSRTSTTTAASTPSSSRWSGCATSGRSAPTPSRLSRSCAARCTTSSRTATAPRSDARVDAVLSRARRAHRRAPDLVDRRRRSGARRPALRRPRFARRRRSQLARAARPRDARPRQPRRRRRLVRRDSQGARPPPRLRPAADLRRCSSRPGPAPAASPPTPSARPTTTADSIVSIASLVYG